MFLTTCQPTAPQNARLESDACGFRSALAYSFKAKSLLNNMVTHSFASHLASNPTLKTNSKKVAIILGYYNGEKYLAEQLSSIFKQSHNTLHVFISDDGSGNSIDFENLGINDINAKRLSSSVRPHNIGFTHNFLNALGSIEATFEYFAFSDQDDIWHKDKLQNAVDALAKYPQNIPALYCARTAITDASCERVLGHSPLFKKTPSFANALVQNIGGGNTMVFNKAARDLIVEASIGVKIVSHDWWCYQIVSGSGGKVIYDPKPCLKYRQHVHNIIGANTSWRARITRIRGLLQGNFRTWNDINLKALAAHKSLLTKQNQHALKDFIAARHAHLLQRIFLFKRSGIYRQTLFGNLGLLLGILINKI